jgi:hypothetical protein
MSSKLGLFSRVAARQAGKARVVRAAWAATRAVGSSLVRAAHLLWLQITGLLFAAFAVTGMLAVVREYGKYSEGKTGPGRVIATLAFSLVFAWFGASSFWRAGRR